MSPHQRVRKQPAHVPGAAMVTVSPNAQVPPAAREIKVVSERETKAFVNLKMQLNRLQLRLARAEDRVGVQLCGRVASGMLRYQSLVESWKP